VTLQFVQHNHETSTRTDQPKDKYLVWTYVHVDINTDSWHGSGKQ